MLSDGAASTAVLLSGGLDSAILVGHLLAQGRRVQPIYIRTGVRWQEAELRAVERFLAALPSLNRAPLVQLEMPLADLYRGHWSITGDEVPDGDTPDEAVYLPGRNPLLLVKAFVWCQLAGAASLALATLKSNPFADATDSFFRQFEAAIQLATCSTTTIWRPFADLDKQEVMRLGANLPLGETFSCIAPRGVRHCGQCNKCAERRKAFRQSGLTDPTAYANETPLLATNLSAPASDLSKV